MKVQWWVRVQLGSAHDVSIACCWRLQAHCHFVSLEQFQSDVSVEKHIEVLSVKTVHGLLYGCNGKTVEVSEDRLSRR